MQHHHGPRDSHARAEVESMCNMLREHLGQLHALDADACGADAARAVGSMLVMLEALLGTFPPSQETREPDACNTRISRADISSDQGPPRSQDGLVAPLLPVPDLDWQEVLGISMKKQKRRKAGSCTLQDRADGSSAPWKQCPSPLPGVTTNVVRGARRLQGSGRA